MEHLEIQHVSVVSKSFFTWFLCLKYVLLGNENPLEHYSLQKLNELSRVKNLALCYGRKTPEVIRKPNMNEEGQVWRRLRQISNHENLETIIMMLKP